MAEPFLPVIPAPDGGGGERFVISHDFAMFEIVLPRPEEYQRLSAASPTHRKLSREELITRAFDALKAQQTAIEDFKLERKAEAEANSKASAAAKSDQPPKKTRAQRKLDTAVRAIDAAVAKTAGAGSGGGGGATSKSPPAPVDTKSALLESAAAAALSISSAAAQIELSAVKRLDFWSPKWAAASGKPNTGPLPLFASTGFGPSTAVEVLYFANHNRFDDMEKSRARIGSAGSGSGGGGSDNAPPPFDDSEIGDDWNERREFARSRLFRINYRTFEVREIRRRGGQFVVPLPINMCWHIDTVGIGEPLHSDSGRHRNSSGSGGGGGGGSHNSGSQPNIYFSGHATREYFQYDRYTDTLCLAPFDWAFPVHVIVGDAWGLFAPNRPPTASTVAATDAKRSDDSTPSDDPNWLRDAVLMRCCGLSADVASLVLAYYYLFGTAAVGSSGAVRHRFYWLVTMKAMKERQTSNASGERIQHPHGRGRQLSLFDPVAGAVVSRAGNGMRWIAETNQYLVASPDGQWIAWFEPDSPYSHDRAGSVVYWPGGSRGGESRGSRIRLCQFTASKSSSSNERTVWLDNTNGPHVMWFDVNSTHFFVSSASGAQSGSCSGAAAPVVTRFRLSARTDEQPLPTPLHESASVCLAPFTHAPPQPPRVQSASQKSDRTSSAAGTGTGTGTTLTPTSGVALSSAPLRLPSSAAAAVNDRASSKPKSLASYVRESAVRVDHSMIHLAAAAALCPLVDGQLFTATQLTFEFPRQLVGVAGAEKKSGMKYPLHWYDAAHTALASQLLREAGVERRAALLRRNAKNETKSVAAAAPDQKSTPTEDDDSFVAPVGAFKFPITSFDRLRLLAVEPLSGDWYFVNIERSLVIPIKRPLHTPRVRPPHRYVRRQRDRPTVKPVPAPLRYERSTNWFGWYVSGNAVTESTITAHDH